MTEQTTIDCRPADLATARAVGAVAGQLAADKAEREVPGFAARAEAAVLDKLTKGPASGEDITDHVQQVVGFGDGRCMGPIFASLLRRGLIVVIGEARRRRGHGSRGGSIYSRCG
jgi:hypothetical protein